MPKTSKQAHRLSRQAGVTLLELLVVLVIMASMTAAIAVPMTRRAPSQAEQMADLNGVLSNARWQARQAQAVVSVASAQAKDPASPYTLPVFVRFAGTRAQQQSLVFYPDGSARGPDLLIKDEEFGIDVLTGAVYAK